MNNFIPTFSSSASEPSQSVKSLEIRLRELSDETKLSRKQLGIIWDAIEKLKLDDLVNVPDKQSLDNRICILKKISFKINFQDEPWTKLDYCTFGISRVVKKHLAQGMINQITEVNKSLIKKYNNSIEELSLNNSEHSRNMLINFLKLNKFKEALALLNNPFFCIDYNLKDENDHTLLDTLLDIQKSNVMGDPLGLVNKINNLLKSRPEYKKKSEEEYNNQINADIKLDEHGRTRLMNLLREKEFKEALALLNNPFVDINYDLKDTNNYTLLDHLYFSEEQMNNGVAHSLELKKIKKVLESRPEYKNQIEEKHNKQIQKDLDSITNKPNQNIREFTDMLNRYADRNNDLEKLFKKCRDLSFNFDFKDSEGKTALMYAIMDGKNKIAKEILSCNCDCALKDTQGKTALDYAENAKKEIEKEIEIEIELRNNKNNKQEIEAIGLRSSILSSIADFFTGETDKIAPVMDDLKPIAEIDRDNRLIKMNEIIEAIKKGFKPDIEPMTWL